MLQETKEGVEKMKFSSTQNLQLNMEQLTLSKAQQELLLAVIKKLLKANYYPLKGSILIVRTWADGVPEEILSGDLGYGKAKNCRVQKLEQSSNSGPRLVNDKRFEHFGSNRLVGWGVSAALQCDIPDTFYYGRIHADVGSVYAENGHYILSLPLEDGRIVASFRADYCQRGGAYSSCVNEEWQHRLMLAGLAEALYKIMPQDKRLATSFKEVKSVYWWRRLVDLDANSNLISRCIARKKIKKCKVINIANSKMPATRRRVAYA